MSNQNRELLEASKAVLQSIMECPNDCDLDTYDLFTAVGHDTDCTWGRFRDAVTADKESLDLRPTLLQSAEAVEVQLRQNDHKGGWEGVSYIDLHRHLWQEIHELDRAIFRYQQDPSEKTRAGIGLEVADIQAMAMMMADRVGCYPHGNRENGRDTEGLSPLERMVNAGWDRQEAEDDLRDDQEARE